MLYTDPGTGSIVLQVAFAALAAGAIFVRRWWATAASSIRRALSRLRRPGGPR
jgi:hypothetical protein